MDEKNDMDKIDDVMLPGFRFHPTDEELVGFYLRRKIQQRLLPIELIKQVDIYKYDPWDLPKLASTGEKEWYFYCPRDRKYRNSARPNRVTGAGFWKATGTDRPIYSSEGSKCIGLKKSLVFYRGRAAKGIKTDWMMHEFRLPSLSESAPPPKKLLDKSLPANDAWAICRIFKKTNSMAQRALSHSWGSPFPEPTAASGLLNQGAHCTQFSSENMSCTTDIGSSIQSIPNGFMFSPGEMSGPISPALIGDLSNATGSIDFDGSQQQQFSGFSINLSQNQMQENMETGQNEGGFRKNLSSSTSHANNNNNNNGQWGSIRPIAFPFSLASDDDAWKPTLPSDSPPCPSDMSTSYSTNKCYT
ncbi:unnamed protein product [Prunus armeniaca]|uniref:NAC domain-containing protein n=1 Tax=Prunus armeniaca TaxID=36596 RepID=A0A6J5WYB9_PRUAR|nr:unnamed protein product [Prunus armeniaca]